MSNRSQAGMKLCVAAHVDDTLNTPNPLLASYSNTSGDVMLLLRTVLKLLKRPGSFRVGVGVALIGTGD